MSRHEMVERPDFFHVLGRGMQQEESGLESEDVWDYMVEALRNEWIKDLLTEDDEPITRGRHHKEES